MMAITWISVIEARRLIRRENLEPLGIITLSIHFSLRTLEPLIKDETWIVYALSSATAVRPTKPLTKGRILLARAARLEPERPGDFPVVELNFSVGRPVNTEGSSLRSELKIPPAKRMLLMVGAGHIWQTPHIAFEALRDRDDVQLVIVGAIANELEADAATAWATPPIVVNGHLPIEELDRYYAAADVVVIAVREGFPHDSGVLFDAASHGVPVIVAGASTPATTVAKFEAGECFEAGSASSLLAALDRLDPSRAAIGSRSLADHYSARNVAAAYLSVLGCNLEG